MGTGAAGVSRYGPWALIAGGSEGVGASFARLLAADGISSVLVARKPEPLEQTAGEVRVLGAEARVIAADLLEAGSVEQIADATGDLDLGLLIVNAGANSYGSPFLEGDLDRFHDVVGLSVRAPMELVRHLGPRIVARGRGGILVVGSMSGYVGQPNLSVYAASKAFERIFTEGLWEELRPQGIDVLHLVLGVTRTPAMERGGLKLDVPGLVAAEPDDVAREGLERLPHGPVHVIGSNAKAAERLSRFPRDEVVSGHAAMIRKLFA
jgi:short-subunit dehydrogenase